jgi:hypothetical protein
MTDDRRRVLTAISLGAAVAMFSLALPLNPVAGMPTTASTVHAAQGGLSQVEKAQGWRRPGWGRRRVCFWRFGRRHCVWR